MWLLSQKSFYSFYLIGGIMKLHYIFLLFVFIFTSINAQSKIDDDITPAFMNAKKGIYWVLSNIPIKKSKIENDLIADDKLYSSVKLEKEIGGIKVESTGYSESISVTVTVYKSYDSLKKEGYIKKVIEPDLE
jgi:hypothetical protein